MAERAANGLASLDSPALVMLIGIAIAMFGAAWQLYRLSTGGSGASTSPIANQATVILTPPEERHELKWNPKRNPEIQIGLEGKIIEGRWSVPVFYVRATNNVAIGDVTVEWKADFIAPWELLNSPSRLSENGVSLYHDNKDELIVSGQAAQKQDWTYPIARSASYQIPFVSPNPPGAQAPLPGEVFNNARFYILSKLPVGVGGILTPIPFTVTVSWTYPIPGKQRFSVIGTAKNLNPADAEEPLVRCVIEFTVKEIE